MRTIFFAFAVGLLAAPLVFAQGTAQISGTIQDQSGLVIAGAAVRVTQAETGQLRTATTSANGTYAFPNLPIGPYRLDVSKDGFASYTQTGIVLTVDTNPTVNATLQVGASSQHVEVTANAAMVEAHASGVGSIVDNQRVVDLPLNGRQTNQLMLLAGGTATAAQPPETTKAFPTIGISVAGGNATGISFSLDGSTYNDSFDNENLPLPFPELLQEFKVETGALDAQSGGHSTAQVNAVMRSGGNSFHADAFEFVRNYLFNARNFFQPARDSLKRNQFGGTFGGPILKNKLFFFGGFQETIVRSNPTATTTFVPTAAMLAGDFTAVTSPACRSTGQLNLTGGFVGNKISPALFNPAAVKLASYLPPAINSCGLVDYGIPSPQDEQDGAIKVDYQATAKHSMFVRYYEPRQNDPAGYALTKDVLNSTAASELFTSKSLSFGDTYLLSGELINSFHFTYNRPTVNRTNGGYFDLSQLGVPVYSAVPGYTQLSVSGAFGVGGTTVSPGHFDTQTWQLADDINLIHGRHQIAFGVNFIHARQNSLSNQAAGGQYTFSTNFTGLGMADFLLGDLASFDEASAYHYTDGDVQFNLYAQDSFKVNSRLTINAGLRWEPYFPAGSSAREYTHFDMGDFSSGVHSTLYPGAPAGLLFAGDPGMPSNAPNYGRMANFAPRVGMVLDPRGFGRETIRVSFGVFYDFQQLFWQDVFASTPPWGSEVSITESSAGAFANPWQGYPGGNPFPFSSSTAIFPTGGLYQSFPLHPHNPEVFQRNVSFQKQLGRAWLLSVSYLGNQSSHLWAGYQINPAVYVPGTCGTALCTTTTNTTSRRLLTRLNPTVGPLYSTITGLDDGSTGNYNGMVLSVTKRLANNFSAIFNYTYSHCISDPVSLELAGASYTYPTTRSMLRSSCSQDARQVMSFTPIYQTPAFGPRVVRAVVGEWRLSGIIAANSGNPFGVASGTDTLGNGAGTTANVTGDPYAVGKGQVVYLNTAAFSNPSPGVFGNLGTNALVGPGRFNINLSLARVFIVREHQKLEFRAEVFNILNNFQPTNPNATITSSLFGQITAANDPRIMQFGFKYSF